MFCSQDGWRDGGIGGWDREAQRDGLGGESQDEESGVGGGGDESGGCVDGGEGGEFEVEVGGHGEG